MQLFNNNRMSNLNRWFDFIEYIRLTTNLNDLRLILLSSLTIGISDYSIDIQDNTLSITSSLSKGRIKSGATAKKDNNKDINFSLNDNVTIRTVTSPGLSNKFRLSNKSEITNYNTEINTNNMNDNNSIINKSNFKSFTGSQYADSKNQSSTALVVGLANINQVYEPLLDNLLDLNDSSELKKTKKKESLNMMFINRTILLIDLARSLEDKYFIENYLFSLCNIVNDIIIEVSISNK